MPNRLRVPLVEEVIVPCQTPGVVFVEPAGTPPALPPVSVGSVVEPPPPHAVSTNAVAMTGASVFRVMGISAVVTCRLTEALI
jgi:hypothetical protein